MINQHELIANGWALTESIEAAVSEENWVRAAELAQERSTLLMRLHAEQSADDIAIIRKIQASMDAVNHRAQAAQAALATVYRRSMEGASAVSRYHQAARF